jgi:hypothetical protein
VKSSADWCTTHCRRHSSPTLFTDGALTTNTRQVYTCKNRIVLCSRRATQFEKRNSCEAGAGQDSDWLARRSDISQTPLDLVDGWTADYVSKMREAWITTAEQVVALGATDGGVRAISEQLQVESGTAQRLLEAARANLPAATGDDLEQPADTSEFGLGVLPPIADDNDNS